jgi:hypothetical protein
MTLSGAAATPSGSRGTADVVIEVEDVNRLAWN